MRSYVWSRIVTTLLIVLGAMLLLFSLTLIVPGDPATALLGPQATPEFARRFISDMGLDQPVHVRLWRFLSHAAVGDLGSDVVTGRKVWDIVAGALPYTVALTFTAIFLAVITGVPLGVFAATHRGSLADTLLAVTSVAFIAIPSFVIAILLLIVFSIWLDWFPVLGAGNPGDWRDQAARLVLPSVSIGLGWVGFIARLVRTSMLEVLGENHIRTMRAFGLPERVVVYKYALKNAVTPTIAVLGLGVGRLLSQAVLVEIVFARPGIGRLIYDSINTRNYPVLQGAILIVVLLFVLINLLVDLSYSLIDPRLRARTG